MGIPHRSAMTSWGVRFDKRYALVHSATMACTRGPKPPVGTPGGTAARVEAPQAGQRTRCKCYSVTSGFTGGTSVT
jgi:hypothetical protein